MRRLGTVCLVAVSALSTPAVAFAQGPLNLLDLALGGKFNIGDNLLINTNVLVPLNDAGVRASVTPVIGFDYSF